MSFWKNVRNPWLRERGLSHRAAAHEQASGFNDEAGIPAEVGIPALQILPVQSFQCRDQIQLFRRTVREGILPQMLRQIDAQLGFIDMMGSQTVRPVFVVRECEGICHIVGQFAQRIVVPQIPAVFLFQPLQPGQNIGTGIGKVVSAQQSGCLLYTSDAADE